MHNIYQQVAGVFLGIAMWSIIRQVIAWRAGDIATRMEHRRKALVFIILAAVLLVVNRWVVAPLS